MALGLDADPQFLANPMQVAPLMHGVHTGEIVLPDFQRSFTWEPPRTAKLIRSMMSRYPAGTFLFWEVGEENKGFASRPVEGVTNLTSPAKSLVLDGQQRLTSLYRALHRKGDARYFVDIEKFVELPTADSPGRVLDPDEIEFDEEEAIFWRQVDSKEEIALRDRSFAIANHIFALDEFGEFHEWLDDYVETHTSVQQSKQIKAVLRKFNELYLRPLQSYGFPVVTLSADTKIEAVATVFESINSTGKPLGPFELLTARFFPNKVHLRDLWDESVETYPILETFGVDPYSVLQAITLKARGSAQRADVLRHLKAEHVKAHWQDTVTGFARVIEHLRVECGVAIPKLLPYTMLLVPLAATWDQISSAKGAEQANALSRLKQYFWCTVFTANFDQGANSQAGADFHLLQYWLADGTATAPEAVKDFRFSHSALRTATTRRKALNSGVLALTVMEGARDFYTGAKLQTQILDSDRRIDSHHIFPKAHLAKASFKPGVSPELILNRALIDSATNRAISSKAPSVYINDVRGTISIPNDMEEIFRSHLIDPSATGPLLLDDYEGFIEQRLSDVIGLIEKVTGAKTGTITE